MELPKIDPKVLPIQHDNTIYNSDGILTVVCGDTEIPESQYQKLGQDKGTKVIKGIPSDSVIISWAKRILGMK